MKKKNIILIIVLALLTVALFYLLFKIPIVYQQPGGKGVSAAVATIYVKDQSSGSFNVWNGLAFGQNNPLPIPNGLSVILPAGEYYVTVNTPGYDPINSLITKVNEQSIVIANINLGRKKILWNKIVSTLSPRDSSNNFSLNVTPLPQEHLLRVGEYLPIISAYDVNNAKKVFLNETYDKPVIVYVFSTWNVAAQEQMDIFKKVVARLKDKYIFIPISTMEPGSINETKINRGEYGIDFYRPDNKFYDDYMIISLPQFFLATNRGELVGVIVGSRSEDDLVKMIEQMYTK